jgi:hypothetical protein
MPMDEPGLAQRRNRRTHPSHGDRVADAGSEMMVIKAEISYEVGTDG